jgi:DivIVA domain-containing protein
VEKREIMVTYKLTPREIYETDFDTKMRGYDKDQVDEMLDSVIVDYETYQAELLKLQEENEFLKNRVAELETGRGGSASNNLDQTQRFDPFKNQSQQAAVPAGTSDLLQHSAPFQSKEPSNFELLKRINRLERAVFGPDSKYGGDTSEL